MIDVRPNNAPGLQFEYNNQLQPGPAKRLKVKTGDGIRWRLRVIRPQKPPSTPPYLIYFKTTSPLATNVVNVPHGGLSPLQEVTDFLGGGHFYAVAIPSLDLTDDPEIQVDGLNLLRAPDLVVEDRAVQIVRDGDEVTVDLPALEVRSDWQVTWHFVNVTGGGSVGEKFTVHFDIGQEVDGPFTDKIPVIEGRVDNPPSSAQTPSRQVNPVEVTHAFTYSIEVENGPTKEGLTLTVAK